MSLQLRTALVILGLTGVLAGCSERPSAAAPEGPLTVRVGVVTVVVEPAVVAAARDVEVDLQAVIRPALERVTGELRSPLSTVRIEMDASKTIPEIGMGGFSDPRTGAVSISLDAQSRIGSATTLVTWLPHTLAHELNHTARILDGPGYGGTLLDAMVSEGLATEYERTLEPAVEVPWADAFGPDQEAALWARAQEALGSTDRSTNQAWRFGGDGIPRWTTYTLGSHIIRAYRAANPNVDWMTLTRRPSGEILAASAYGKQS